MLDRRLLSPYLFNIDIDDLSVKLNLIHAGCIAGNVIVNHLLYADDLVLISPSTYSMSQLLSACELFSQEYYLQYNTVESGYLKFPNYETLPLLKLQPGPTEFIMF